jgi:predicted ATP-grasp superfamily ATP-dependent carboligase
MRPAIPFGRRFMRVFLYEFFSGGGLWHWPAGLADGSILAEGRGMIDAIAADFSALENVKVFLTRDSRSPVLAPLPCEIVPVASANDERQIMRHFAKAADWTLLIAPETRGALLARSRLVESAGGRLLSPSSACVEIAGSKTLTAEALMAAGVPVPRAADMTPGDRHALASLRLPVVAKPVDGCGSQGIRLLRAVMDDWDTGQGIMRLEEFVPGLAASVAVLCGPAGNHALLACEQRLSTDGQFKYLGGRLPIDPQLDARARKLALAAVGALPRPRGYFGVDLVLGQSADGSDDRVIEINPRLTTSYAGLRRACGTNLAAAMLAVAAGEPPDLCFRHEPVEFLADGTIL